MSTPSSTAEFEDPLSGHRADVHAAVIPPTDGERLMRFYRYRDEGAFAELIEMHAPMVWGVCSQVLRHHQDVEDAFQATFLILARKGRLIRGADSVAGWLYRVAFRTALLARDQRMQRNETPLVDEPRTPDDQLAAVQRNDQCLALLEELNALPARYREPLVLCHLEGRSRRETADEMGVTLQAVKGLLARGTRLLRSRLVRRGAALSTSMAAVNASLGASQAAAAPALVSATAALGSSFALKLKISSSGIEGASLNGGAPYAYALAEKGILAMTVVAASKPAVGLLGICLTIGVLAVAAAEPAKEQAVGGAPAALVLTNAPPSAGTELNAAVDVAVEPASAGVLVAKPGEGDPRIMVFRRAAGPAPTTASLDEPSGEKQGAKSLDVTVTSPAGAALFMPAAGSAWTPMSAAPQQISFPFNGRNASSAATLKLELEYWQLKAKGLQQKAEAMAMKAEGLRSSGRAPAAEAMELEAEAQLTLAEVKLCEMNAQRVRESLQAAAEASIEGAEAALHRPAIDDLRRAMKEYQQAAQAADHQAAAERLAAVLAHPAGPATAGAGMPGLKAAVEQPAVNVERAIKVYQQAANAADHQPAAESLAAVLARPVPAAVPAAALTEEVEILRQPMPEQLLMELKKINEDLQRRIEELESRLEKSDPRPRAAVEAAR